MDLHEERDDDGFLGRSGISWTIYANNLHLAPGGVRVRPRTGISSGTLRSVMEYGLPLTLPFYLIHAFLGSRVKPAHVPLSRCCNSTRVSVRHTDRQTDRQTDTEPGRAQARISAVTTCAVADEALAIWSSEAPDENQ